ncbi:integrase arm-type DNA-binding domain-containing protein [Rhizobium pusense]|uniref:tyrosine-type recombinase/integrase n=1 Tax=Agrobacterium pusense TaxID=648995 RepID=UPI00244CB612|nr:integrase arm-type DNA-binding domain-containing protein [Agrobacterium pusense]MDH1271293.1 integrase arm-type DNA-binding domain-containing protein [Agrobacterium pusense]
MPLSDLKCRNAKPAEKDYKLTDGGRLYLLVRPNGSKLWRMNYEYAGKQKTLSIGAYPLVSLADARQSRETAKEHLAYGRDPAQTSVDHPERTFKSVSRRWWDARKARWNAIYAERIWDRLEDRVFPRLGELDITKIAARDILALIQDIEAEGKHDLARRVRQYVSGVFRYAIASGMTGTDPSATVTDAMKAKPKTVHRAAIREDELPEFFRRLRNYGGEEQTSLALELLIHTAVRSKELRLATWSEFDVGKRNWRIPEERMKMKREHLVPLTDRTLEILCELKEIAGDSDLIVPSPDKVAQPISNNTLLYCLYRIGYHSRATVHGFRSTFSTMANESGLWRKDAIEMQLAHSEEDESRDAYNAALYLAERTKMMTWYSEKLVALSKKVVDRDDLLEGLI